MALRSCDTALQTKWGQRMSSDRKAGATSQSGLNASKGMWILHVFTELLEVFSTGWGHDLTLFFYLVYVQNSSQVLFLKGVKVS